MIALLAALPAVLIVDGFVVGSRTGTSWKPADESFARQTPSIQGQRFGIGTVTPGIRRIKLVAEEVDQASYVDNEPDLTFIGGAAPRALRKVTALKGDIYVPIVKKALAARGIQTAKPRILGVYRVDLDGDRTDEVIIEASSPSEPANHADAGSYSMILLRGFRNGRVQETTLAFSPNEPQSYLSVARLRGVADLDGDGKMEIVIGKREFEGSSATLWSYRKGTAKKLLENGVGH